MFYRSNLCIFLCSTGPSGQYVSSSNCKCGDEYRDVLWDRKTQPHSYWTRWCISSKFDISYIMITPGQTMDVLFTANQSPADNYYMAASSSAASDAPYDETSTSALVVYNYPSSVLYPQLPLPNNTSAAISLTSQIKNSESVNLQEGFDERIIITVSANQLPCDLDECDGPRTG
ncbi:hypothetical protein CIPAW_15G007800 [Carya illinoinensis]|uniref:Plastocyanin-like domain-containing protein n=1 Tax=Carya illinoinensis TaxID=32201 RepID=A0A8T1N761_CARIL|nr:hypothetical protein CIPAW_15G007800 [Carya illinoinensis]